VPFYFQILIRLGLAQALMEKPRLLLLDEPTNGLDPAGIIKLRHILKDVAAQGTTIFLASHLLTEVERICDRVILVKQGKIVREIVPAAPGNSYIKLVVSNASRCSTSRTVGKANGFETFKTPG
jgi:ABC-type multidrug transport system ATPase subunit